MNSAEKELATILKMVINVVSSATPTLIFQTVCQYSTFINYLCVLPSLVFMFSQPSLYLIIQFVVENYNVTIVERGNHLIYIKYESLECLQNFKIHQWLFSTYMLLAHHSNGLHLRYFLRQMAFVYYQLYIRNSPGSHRSLSPYFRHYKLRQTDHI